MGKNKKKSRFLPKNVLAFVFREERRSGIILLIAAALAIVVANSAWSETYFAALGRELTFGAVTLDLRHWINEGLMAIFFLVVVLEIKRELIDGELRSWRKASFICFAALGGMIVPALLFSTINPYPPQSAGWAIPMSTDTAIAIGVLGLLGKKIPKNLKVFLLAIAIIDDIVSILVIGLFYSQPTNMLALMIAVVLSLTLLAVRTKKLQYISFPVLGFCIWYCLLLAGVSGTVAGVIVAALAPLTTRRLNSPRLQTSEEVEEVLLPLTAYMIIPVFVFANAGLDLSRITLSTENELMVFIGVTAGLLIGKPLGIFSASWAAVMLKLAHKPRGMSWPQLVGIGYIAGIGFTISLLITDLAYRSYSSLQHAAILGVFTASIASGFIGMWILKSSRRRYLPRPK
jgi:NhaA family Na+:H+ antiporter